jgi:hypothetical protein
VLHFDAKYGMITKMAPYRGPVIWRQDMQHNDTKHGNKNTTFQHNDIRHNKKGITIKTQHLAS